MVPLRGFTVNDSAHPEAKGTAVGSTECDWTAPVMSQIAGGVRISGRRWP
jgi:hypothetical protein